MILYRCVSVFVCVRCLLFIAYRFSGGPFRNLWIRNGLDPRIDSSCAKYQLIDFRFPTYLVSDKLTGSKWSTVSEEPLRVHAGSSGHAKPDGEDGGEDGDPGGGGGGGGGGASDVYTADVSFSRPPTKKLAVWYQFCDLAGDEIQKVLQNSPLVDSPDVWVFH